jgi:murein DD-endopeptidase MepM/ murein hydrolase activator NlpD
MNRRGALRLLALLALGAFSAAAGEAPAAEIRRTVGKLSLTADTRFAYQGGLLLLRLKRGLGTTYAVFGGRRIAFHDTPRGPLALMPIPVDAPAVPTTLGVEVLGRRGRQRVRVDDVAVAARPYPPRTLVIPEERRELLRLRSAVTDGRRLLQALRTSSPESLGLLPFTAPVAGSPTPSFGAPMAYVGGSPVDSMMDSVYGEYHRGQDYAAGAGMIVLAPAAGVVALATPLTLSGPTLVLDHGWGVASAFFHLGRIDVREGERVEARQPIGLVGDGGIADAPHVHWGVYVHGVAVDPAIFLSLTE